MLPPPYKNRQRSLRLCRFLLSTYTTELLLLKEEDYAGLNTLYNISLKQEQNGVPNGFLLCKGSFIGKILANWARIIPSHNPSQVGMVFERLINIVASCDKVSQKSLAKLARLFYNNFRPSWAEVIEIIIPNLGIFFGSNFPTTCREVGR